MPASGEEVQEQKLHRPDIIFCGVEGYRRHRDNNQGQRIHQQEAQRKQKEKLRF